MAKKEEMKKDIVQKSDFRYSAKGVNLSFTLRTDNTSELRPFKELLVAAIADVNEIINKLPN